MGFCVVVYDGLKTDYKECMLLEWNGQTTWTQLEGTASGFGDG